MPRGSAVIPYHGARGTTWRIKYADSTGKQVMETVGAERDGWTKAKAEAELRERLVRVDRKVDERDVGPCLLGQPPQRRPLGAAPHPEVEHYGHACAQGMVGEPHVPALEDVALPAGVRAERGVPPRIRAPGRDHRAGQGGRAAAE